MVDDRIRGLQGSKIDGQSCLRSHSEEHPQPVAQVLDILCRLDHIHFHAVHLIMLVIKDEPDCHLARVAVLAGRTIVVAAKCFLCIFQHAALEASYTYRTNMPLIH